MSSVYINSLQTSFDTSILVATCSFVDRSLSTGQRKIFRRRPLTNWCFEWNCGIWIMLQILLQILEDVFRQKYTILSILLSKIIKISILYLVWVHYTHFVFISHKTCKKWYRNTQNMFWNAASVWLTSGVLTYVDKV